jgi:hypothetical protein
VATSFYWLVGTKGSVSAGNEITGGASKVVENANEPSGYDSVTKIGTVGQSKKTIEQALANALPSLPTGISIEDSYNVPGIGTLTLKKPGGIAGTLDQGASTTGNAAQATQNTLTNIFGNLDTWKGIGLVVAGAAILIFAAIEFKNLAR